MEEKEEKEKLKTQTDISCTEKYNEEQQEMRGKIKENSELTSNSHRYPRQKTLCNEIHKIPMR